AAQLGAVRTGPVARIGQRQRGRHAPGDRQRHAPHARLQVHVHRHADLGNRVLPQDRAAAGSRGPGSGQARRTRRGLNRSPITTSDHGDYAMTRAGARLAGLMAALVSTTMLVPAHAADAILSGAVAGPGGDKMGGVTVSAKADGSTITTTV